jgi:hypothetical protein
VSTDLVTRERLAEWGFLRLPDVWLPCPSEGRYKYFERWYHARWNYTTIVGRSGKDPLSMTQDHFLAALQAHILEDEEEIELEPWDDVLGGI